MGCGASVSVNPNDLAAFIAAIDENTMGEYNIKVNFPAPTPGMHHEQSRVLQFTFDGEGSLNNARTQVEMAKCDDVGGGKFKFGRFHYTHYDEMGEPFHTHTYFAKSETGMSNVKYRSLTNPQQSARSAFCCVRVPRKAKTHLIQFFKLRADAPTHLHVLVMSAPPPNS